jgi:hypothetical protein
MDKTEVDEIIVEKLKSAGLLEAVNRDKSQVLDFPEEFFVELVLNDGSKLEETERLIEHVQADLQSRGVRLDSIVRAMWKVREVSKAYDPGWIAVEGRKPGMLTMPFKATLESGNAQTDVWVEMTPSGYNELKRVGQSDEESLKKIVRAFLAVELSVGGTSYWDPIRYERRELNGGAVLHVLQHTPLVTA